MLDKAEYREIEVLAAIDKDPTDIEFVANALVSWEDAGEVNLLASVGLYALNKVSKIESKMDQMLYEMRELRETVSEVSKITTTKLAAKLKTFPELLDGFGVIEEKGDRKIQYKGNTDKISVFKGFDNLHSKLIKYYGYKEITYKTIAEAILKCSNWESLELEDNNSESFLTLVLDNADALYLKKKSKKFTLSELKKQIGMSKVEHKTLKGILLEAGWFTVKQGSSRSLFFTK